MSIRPGRACVLASLFCFSTAAEATLTVEATVTPLAGSFLYEYSIANSGPDDVVLVSIVDAPLGDPLIDPTLTAPVGYLASYDDGLGIVDFLEDTGLFAIGTATSGFSFESLAAPAPGVLRSFEAFEFDGDFLAGDVQTTIIPEPSTLAGVAGMCGVCAALWAGGRLSPRRSAAPVLCCSLSSRGSA